MRSSGINNPARSILFPLVNIIYSYQYRKHPNTSSLPKCFILGSGGQGLTADGGFTELFRYSSNEI